MPARKTHQPDYLVIVLITLGVLLVILVAFLVSEYRTLRRENLINIHRAHFAELYEQHIPLPVSDAGIVRSWMTFAYVNKVFAIPSSTMKTDLMIIDPHYPNISISTWAKEANINSASATVEVQQTITSTLAPRSI